MKFQEHEKMEAIYLKLLFFYFLGQDKMMDKLNLTKEEKGMRF